MVVASPRSQFAEAATLAARLERSELPALERLLSRIEREAGRLAWREAALLALDVREMYHRLPGARTGPLAALHPRLAALHDQLGARAARRCARERRRIRAGGLRGAALLSWLARFDADERDMALEHLLGIARRPLTRRAPDAELIDYVPSGVGAIARAVAEAPITGADVMLDVGAGLGKVAMTVHLLCGARTRGIELQPALVEVARARASDLGLDGVSYQVGDARQLDVADATVVFMYLPFTGAVLAQVMGRLEAAARRRPLVVCTLGLDLAAHPWLAARPTEDLWLSIYDSR
jgi:hypothetical protein